MASCPKNSGTYPSTKNPGISDKTKWKFKESIQTNAGFIDWKNLIVQKKSEFGGGRDILQGENEDKNSQDWYDMKDKEKGTKPCYEFHQGYTGDINTECKNGILHVDLSK